MQDQEFLVQKIRSQYTEQEHTQLDALKALDARVKKPAKVFGWVYGALGAMVMGSGMSLVMTDIGSVLGIADSLIPGIAVGIVGLVMSCTTYPIYQMILTARKKKYAREVLALSEQVLK